MTMLQKYFVKKYRQIERTFALGNLNVNKVSRIFSQTYILTDFDY